MYANRRIASPDLLPNSGGCLTVIVTQSNNGGGSDGEKTQWIGAVEEHATVVHRQRPRVYDEVFCATLIVLWEASDRVCGKRLRALLPLLVPALERRGHLILEPLARNKLLGVSAATIDRLLTEARGLCDRRRVRRPDSVDTPHKRTMRNNSTIARLLYSAASDRPTLADCNVRRSKVVHRTSLGIATRIIRYFSPQTLLYRRNRRLTMPMISLSSSIRSAAPQPANTSPPTTTVTCVNETGSRPPEH